jgi:dTDP-4-amino-4,6-dideoxygalactose transaminase
MSEKFGYKTGDFPVCEYVSARTIALPFFGSLTRQQIDRICTTLNKILEQTLVSRKGKGRL